MTEFYTVIINRLYVLLWDQCVVFTCNELTKCTTFQGPVSTTLIPHPTRHRFELTNTIADEGPTRGSLVSDRISQLESVPGWVWNQRGANRTLKRRALSQFVAREHHALVPQEHIEPIDDDRVKLGHWVMTVRMRYKRGSLDASNDPRL